MVLYVLLRPVAHIQIAWHGEGDDKRSDGFAKGIGISWSIFRGRFSVVQGKAFRRYQALELMREIYWLQLCQKPGGTLLRIDEFYVSCFILLKMKRVQSCLCTRSHISSRIWSGYIPDGIVNLQQGCATARGTKAASS